MIQNVMASIDIHAKPGAVLRSFTDPEHLKKWWRVKQCLVELKTGGSYSLLWQDADQGIGHASTGVITEYLPECRLRIGRMICSHPQCPVLGPMELLILTTPESKTTLLSVVHSGRKEGPEWNKYYESIKVSWPAVLKKLKAYLETPEN